MTPGTTGSGEPRLDLYFSQFFGVDPAVLKEYGAFDISVVSDLPLFVDPFLLFNSSRPEYQALHEEMINYLIFLRDKADGMLDQGLVDAWYRFKEVKQNWLGFTQLGNGGHALGAQFATALHASLGTLLKDFGEEHVTLGTHLEKLCLIRGGIGRDSISDFTTNLIKDYLLQYTEQFARQHLKLGHCRNFNVPRAAFNYATETWMTKTYSLPALGKDYVILTPVDMLTRDETWISHPDMLNHFSQLPEAVPNAQLRAQINNYFVSRLTPNATDREQRAAAQATIERFPELIDHYIRLKEDDGDRADSIASSKVSETHDVLVELVQRLLADLLARTDFYEKAWTSYDEALDRVRYFKHYIEHRDGYLLLNPNGKKPFSREKDVQLFFNLVWYASAFDINREVNNGRGPVDFKISRGAKDKSLVEFKLASNRGLKRNLENQVQIYEAANDTDHSITVIVCYTAEEQEKVSRVLDEVKLAGDTSIVTIDARHDNKPSGSKA